MHLAGTVLAHGGIFPAELSFNPYHDVLGLLLEPDVWEMLQYIVFFSVHSQLFTLRMCNFLPFFACASKETFTAKLKAYLLDSKSNL